MPVIPATWEVEIGQKVSENFISTNKLCMLGPSVICAMQGALVRESWSEVGTREKHETLSEKAEKGLEHGSSGRVPA
jgi:hypothetical protein